MAWTSMCLLWASQEKRLPNVSWVLGLDGIRSENRSVYSSHMTLADGLERVQYPWSINRYSFTQHRALFINRPQSFLHVVSGGWGKDLIHILICACCEIVGKVQTYHMMFALGPWTSVFAVTLFTVIQILRRSNKATRDLRCVTTPCEHTFCWIKHWALLFKKGEGTDDVDPVTEG